MSDESTKRYTTKPTTQLDLEARAKRDYALADPAKVEPDAVDAPFAVEDNDTSAYRGVDRDRMTYANDTEKPLAGDGIEDEVGEQLLSRFAYGEDEPVKGKQTVGSGSSAPSVFVTTSGEDVTHKHVDRKKLGAAIEKAEKAEKPAPLSESVSGAVTEAEGKQSTEGDESGTTPAPAKVEDTSGGGGGGSSTPTPPAPPSTSGGTPPRPPAPPSSNS